MLEEAQLKREGSGSLATGLCVPFPDRGSPVRTVAEMWKMTELKENSVGVSI